MAATALGKEITLERLERLLGPKVVERVKIAALKEQASGIMRVSPQELRLALDWIEGRVPKAHGMNGARPRVAGRASFTRAAYKYLTERRAAHAAFVAWANELAGPQEPPRKVARASKKKK